MPLHGFRWMEASARANRPCGRLCVDGRAVVRGRTPPSRRRTCVFWQLQDPRPACVGRAWRCLSARFAVIPTAPGARGESAAPAHALTASSSRGHWQAPEPQAPHRPGRDTGARGRRATGGGGPSSLAWARQIEALSPARATAPAGWFGGAVGADDEGGWDASSATIWQMTTQEMSAASPPRRTMGLVFCHLSFVI